MSFITRLSTTTTRTAAAPAARLSTISTQRFLSSTTPRQSGPVDATKETLKKADRKVSDAAVKGIETGEAAVNRAKQAVGSGEAQKKAGELEGEAKVLAGKGKGKAEEAAGAAKGKAQEVAGEAKGKAQEFKS
ncbi:hypothetical protein BDV18DRAFT_130676 [Aspergillus unguis]